MKWEAIAGMLLVACGASMARASGGPFTLPAFVGTPYQITVNVSGPGTHGFVFSGSAIDENPDETVTIGIIGSNLPFTLFETAPGNPATFRVAGSGLTTDDIGSYTLRMYAIDNDPRGQQSVATGLRISVIVPEPASCFLGGGVIAALATRRWRRR